MNSVKLQELIEDPENIFMIVSKVAEKNGIVSDETEATFQKVMAAINKTDRPLPDPKIYLAFKNFNESIEGTSTIKGSPLFVLESITAEKLIITEPPLDSDVLTWVVYMSNIMLFVKDGGIHLVRSRFHPANIWVEI